MCEIQWIKMHGETVKPITISRKSSNGSLIVTGGLKETAIKTELQVASFRLSVAECAKIPNTTNVLSNLAATFLLSYSNM